jgi:hypothetical protein
MRLRFRLLCVVTATQLLLLPPYQKNVNSQTQSPASRPGLTKPAVDDERFTNIGNIGLTLTNYGTLGDGFVVQRPVDLPSCEYPLGSGIEHMFDGGLWVGARRADGTVSVTTGAVDVPSLNFNVAEGFEFTNSADPNDIILVRSNLADSPFFDPNAISHQDFIINFTDSNTVIPETGDRIPNHRPLNISVHLEAYAWSFPFADAFVILNYKIKNTGRERLSDVYVGLWGDLVIRNTNITPPRVGAPFYQHVGNGYIDSLFMAYAFDYDGDPGFTDDGLYIAFRLLGAFPQANDQVYQKRTIYNVWLFRNQQDPVLNSPQDDISKYEKMAEPLPASGYASVRAGPGNYMTLLSTGPFAELAPDSTINVVFAVVAAAKGGDDPNWMDTEANRSQLLTNADWAQRAFDGEDKNRNNVLDPGEDLNGNGVLDRYVLPTPPNPPRLKAVPGDGEVTLYWDARSEESIDLITGEKDFEGYRVYRSTLGSDLPGQNLLSSFILIADFDSIDGLGYDTGFRFIRLDEPVTFPDEFYVDPFSGQKQPVIFRYKFVNKNLLNGWQYAYAVTAYDRGDPEQNLPSLESSRLRNVVRVFPGSPPVSKAQRTGERKKIGVYPNPYRTQASWDGLLERDRKIYFYNLPPRAEVRIFTLAGDLVDSFVHDSNTYAGTDIQWFQKLSSEDAVFTGGEHGWDLVTRDDQALATGLYLFTVEDLDSGEIYRGKFLVIK